jgi:hypothetical protein
MKTVTAPRTTVSSRVDRWSGACCIGAGVLLLLGGLLIPVLAPLSTLALAAGYAWVGVALTTGATGTADAPRPSRVLMGDRHV